MLENVICKVLFYIMFRSVVLFNSYVHTNLHKCTHELPVALLHGMSCIGDFKLLFNAFYCYSCLVSKAGHQAEQKKCVKIILKKKSNYEFITPRNAHVTHKNIALYYFYIFLRHLRHLQGD
jgi:hypothetical protein